MAVSAEDENNIDAVVNNVATSKRDANAETEAEAEAEVDVDESHPILSTPSAFTQPIKRLEPPVKEAFRSGNGFKTSDNISREK